VNDALIGLSWAEAVAQAPAREEYRLLLAQVLIEQFERRNLAPQGRGASGQPNAGVDVPMPADSLVVARAILDPLIVRGSRPDVRGAARRMLDRADAASSDAATTTDALVAATPGRAAADGVTAAATVVPGASPAVASAGDVEIRTRERTLTANPASVTGADGQRYRLLLRPVGSGEMRVAGDLLRIECPVAPVGAIVVHVRTADSTMRLRAPGFDHVAFVNFRPDPLPSPRCGPLDPSLHVLATYRPATSSDGEAVAIEIVPADYVPR